MAKVFNLLIALSFIALGIIGVFLPEALASFYGFTLQNIEAKTELRAVSSLSLGVGYLLVYFALVSKKQTVILLCVAGLTFIYFLGRLLGLMLDGFDQPMILKESIIELVVILIALYLYKQEAAKGRFSSPELS